MDVDFQILEGIRKIANVIDNIYNKISFKYNLTSLQLKIIYFLYLKKRENINIKRLSIESNLTLATISKSVKNLIKKGFLEIYQIEDNKKEKYLNLTQKSLNILTKLDSEINKIIDIINKSYENNNKKFETIEILVNIINNLLNKGYITKVSMCNLCVFYEEDGNYCKFLSKRLDYKKIECPDFINKRYAKKL
jgi:DNA-binding MarR family transcriptional regulator